MKHFSVVFIILLIILIIQINSFLKNLVSYQNRQVTVESNIDKLLKTNYESSFISESDLYNNDLNISRNLTERGNKKCTMQRCFNFTKCTPSNFKIYVYNEPSVLVSKVYKEIIQVLSKSSYATSNPEETCLFVPLIDSLDRDRRSKNYVTNYKDQLYSLKYWNNGQNHILFNLYSGSWPSYKEMQLEIKSSMAIIVKASFSIEYYRHNFDVSFPLFHNVHPVENNNSIPASRSNSGLKKYLATFKGKRYLNGIGSEIRNSLKYLNNKRDILVLTTCRHGTYWQEIKDDQCDSDEEEYNRYDYDELLMNSTFCLIPRGRRLGTYRFLEALKIGCIPVILSNQWVLPFLEVLDWDSAVILADERKLFDIPLLLRKKTQTEIFEMRQKGRFYYDKYFSSVEKIVLTSIRILKERIFKNTKKNSAWWNKQNQLV